MVNKTRLGIKFFSLLVSLLLGIGAFECGSMIAIETETVPATRPSYSKSGTQPFWADINPNWGVWHHKIEFRHAKSCFDVVYKANSYGARDKERDRRSSESRIVVLGDSFVEGYGVADADRLTNLLAVRSGIEHLNFGTAGGFGPVGEYKLYESLAQGFDHDAVILAILPDNDFTDDAPDAWRDSKRYRVYWEGSYPDYTLTYNLNDPADSEFNERPGLVSVARSTLRDYTYGYHFVSWNIAAYKYSRKTRKLAAPNQSRYYHYTRDEWDRMRYSIEKIRSLAANKRMMIFAIPREVDFVEYAKNGAPPFSSDMRALCQELDIEFIDLIGPMAGESTFEFFHSCDRHWSPKGNAFAASVLMRESKLYR